ncbi:YolD-like protein [Halanaerobium congolense]|uniref:YolD-like protein n=1 Tax=Halanaerobium congolense TaxID=54121 RepID=A0A1G8T3K9_9FIRM|nr:YolD-like family protein [Halanaerobium congolense]SDJ35981.1 YolD-like protein [Halanaerobium congolense]SET65484.1 YolD-like protein [Halanaerobium congolense]
MNLKDRGNKKWTAMMLIEHRKRLKELKESEKDREKPILDEQEKAAINSKLQQAVQMKLPVEIKYYEDKRFKTVSGVVRKVNLNRKKVIISEKGGKQQKLSLTDLLELRLK